MIECLTIDDPKAAALLSNERSRHIVLALVEHERSQNDLSARLGLTPSLLHYHLGRLLSARLVTVSRVEPRRGRPIRYFRAAARSFFLPAEMTPHLPDGALIEELRRALQTGRTGTYSGILYAWDDGPRMRVVSDRRSGPPLGEMWHRLTLNDADARALIDELRGVFARFETRQNAAGARFLVLGAVAPVP